MTPRSCPKCKGQDLRSRMEMVPDTSQPRNARGIPSRGKRRRVYICMNCGTSFMLPL